MFVPSLGYLILFVCSPEKSAHFYSQLFNLKPIQQSLTFVLFALPGGVMLGLWSKETAEPKVTAQAGSSEICFSADTIDELYEEWAKKRISIAQKPIDMDFGRTFVALDPDGHRIRIYHLHGEN